MRPTLRDVAAAAGVSRQTVSNVINTPDRVSLETRSRVESTILALGYEPNEAARSLTSRKTRTISFSVGGAAHNPSSIEDPFFHALVQAADEFDYRVMALNRGSADREEVAKIRSIWKRQAVDGVIISDTHPHDERPDLLLGEGISFCAFGTPWSGDDARYPWVDVDGAAGIRLAVDHLVERGHRDVGFVSWQPDGAGGDKRLEGWRSALRDHGLPARALSRARVDEADAGQVAATDLLRRDHPPTAIICASDTLALGAIRAVYDASLTPGVDIAVVGYDDSLIAQIARPQLTSLQQPLELVAQFLVRAVIDRSTEQPPSSLVIPPALVVRASSDGWRDER